MMRVARCLSSRSRAGRRVNGYSAYRVVRSGRCAGGMSFSGFPPPVMGWGVGGVGIEFRLSIRDVRNCRGVGTCEDIISLLVGRDVYLIMVWGWDVIELLVM